MALTNPYGPAQPSGQSCDRRVELDRGVASGSSNNAAPRPGSKYGGHSVMDQYVASANSMAPGPTGSDRRLIGMGTHAGEMQTGNGESSSTLAEHISAMQFRNA